MYFFVEKQMGLTVYAEVGCQVIQYVLRVKSMLTQEGYSQEQQQL
jgi:hypothetical protein